ncbi:hypothetical protein [Streptomyces osmaniensis]|uniref:Secreted protein n=1 Tax=Streptomyces osmaniensis TaxID=593134 RepID=A0ABP6Z364_9ACTN|nr:hypothetical protein KJK32_00305 [Streptomyces sp. JCM17656]
MKGFTVHSVTIAACAALLIAGTTTQASADGSDERPAASTAANKGPANITVIGNNNAAGNDLIIGDNNVSGTGHTIGPASQPTPFTSCINIQNASDTPLTSGQAEASDDTESATITRQLPPTLAPNQIAVVCAKSTGPFLSLQATYDINRGDLDTSVQFMMVNLAPNEPAYSIQQPASPYSAGLITRSTDGYVFNSTSFLVDCPGTGGCE